MTISVVRTAAACAIQIFSYAVAIVVAVLFTIVTATRVDTPSLFLSSGLLAAALAVFALSWWPALLLRLKFTVRYVALQTIGTVLVLSVAIGLIFLRPLVPKTDQYVVTIPPGVELWNLPTGSSVAVRKIEGKGPESTNASPIVFVHGGPGAYSVALEQTVKPVSELSNDGHDVYFYDQVGGGLSERLEDISAYSLDRHIADLKALVDRISEDEVVLIGSSFGTTLVSNYIAQHPSGVSHAVFSAAAPIYHPDWELSGDGSLDAAMSHDVKTAFNKAIFKPRLLAAIGLSEINPVAASKFLSQREAGAFFDKIANDFYMPFIVCDVEWVRTQSAGYGFWSNRITSKTLWNRANDPKSALQENNMPVLVIRGECDYKKEAVAKEYVSIFPNASYVSIENAGHMVYWETPEVYLQAIRAFLKQ